MLFFNDGSVLVLAENWEYGLKYGTIIKKEESSLSVKAV